MAQSSDDAPDMDTSLAGQPLPHPLLTKLVAPMAGHESALGEVEIAMLRADATTCVEAMKTRCDDAGPLLSKKARKDQREQTVDYVAAALSLMCGYYRKDNGAPHPTAAARGFGHEISRPTVVTDKQALLLRLEVILQREEAGRAELVARQAGEIVDDERTVRWRERVLATMIAADIWKPRYKELSIDETYDALCSNGGWYDGMGGFDRSKVAAAMDAARSAYAQILESCRGEIWWVLDEHFKRRRPTLHKESCSDERIVNELSAADVRAGLETRGFAFPYAMVRGEMKAAKESYLVGFSLDEMKRAYFAGPPPDLDATDLCDSSDPTEAMIMNALSGRMAKATLNDTTRAQREAKRALDLGLFELTPLEKLDERYRTIVEQSQQWLAAHLEVPAADGAAPPLRPGGLVRIEGLRSRSELNAATGELVQWYDDAGRWRVHVEYRINERWHDEDVRVQPHNLVSLPDSEPWVAEDDPDGEWGADGDRFDWAERHPLQARALGTRFDDAGRPVWFAPPPEHVLASLTASHTAQIFSGSVTERVAEYQRCAGAE